MKKKILILTVFALLAFGCGRTEEVKNTAPANNAPNANAPANTQPEAPPAKEESYTSGVNPRADLISAAQKRQKLPFWSAKVMSGNDTKPIAEMKYAAPDRYHFKTLMGEAIVIGNTSYSNEDGKWEKDEDGEGESIREQITKGINEGAFNLKDVQITGKEKINGTDATVYFYKAGNVTTKIWLATDSGLELKNEIEAETEAGIKQKQTMIYDYQTPVKIEAPKID